ncbi:conjugal transfer protein TraB [Streptomyces sp. NPDC008150]|uniref:conjugal transfer protein TraB n=1 Tax=Streptomyces sp. NPDC008150 TaxID=3364816 RepID=UPI0036EDBC2A
MADNAIEPTTVQTGAEASTTPTPATGSNPKPEKPSWGGVIAGIINFVTLTARITALAVAAALLKEQLHLLKARMHHDAERGRRLADHLRQARVDEHFQAQTLEVAAAFERVAAASGELADAADGMEANASAVRDAHQAEYAGIYEVRQASPYAQPRPGFNQVR